jgi:hypothetical protein
LTCFLEEKEEEGRSRKKETPDVSKCIDGMYIYKVEQDEEELPVL